MGWSDSDHEEAPPKKRLKRNSFKKLRRQIADVSVDVYRSLKLESSEPWGGAQSFFEERFEHWKELNAASDFKDVAEGLQDCVGTLPQIVHHKEEILDRLIGKLIKEAALSVEPVTDLIAALARDLQDDFVPMLPRVTASMSDLVDDCCQDPATLQAIFNSLSSIFKHLTKQLASKLPLVLTITSRLQSHRVAHVRKLTAQSISFLFRQAPSRKLAMGAKALLSGCCTQRHNDYVMEGVGLVIAQSCVGIQHQLHSKAEDILGLVMQPGLLNRSDFKVAGKNGGKRGREGSLENCEETNSLVGSSKKELEWLSGEFIQERCGAAVEIGLKNLVEIVKQSQSERLWMTVLKEARSRVDKLVACGQSMGVGNNSGAQNARDDLARCVGWVAVMVEHDQGRRVPNFNWVAQLIDQLSSQDVLQTPNTELGVSTRGGSVCGKALRLLLAFTMAKCSVMDQENLCGEMGKWVASWGRLLVYAEPDDVFSFTEGLARPPGGSHTTSLFANQLLNALSRIMESGSGEVESDHASKALFLISEVCVSVRKERGFGFPILSMVQYGRKKLSDYIVGKIDSWPGEEVAKKGGLVSKLSVGFVWLALSCIPDACTNPGQISRLCESLLVSLDSIMQGEKDRSRDGMDLDDAIGWADQRADQEDLIFLVAKVKHLLFEMTYRNSKADAVRLAERDLVWLEEYPENYHVLATVAGEFEMLAGLVDTENDQGVKGGDLELAKEVLSVNSFERMLPIVTRLLESKSKNVRKDALKLISSFEQPAMADSNQESKQTDRCTVLKVLYEIESQPCDFTNDRKTLASIDRLKVMIECGKIPKAMFGTVVNALLGLMHIKFSILWKPVASAVSTALKTQPEDVFPKLYSKICESQRLFLSGQAWTSKKPSTGCASLETRYKEDISSGSAMAAGGHTDALTCLCSFLSALEQGGGKIMTSQSENWVVLFNEYLDGRPQRKRSGLGYSPDAWAKGLKSWLLTISITKNMKAAHKGTDLAIRIAPLLAEDNSGVQTNTLKCLAAYNIKHLNAYMERLQAMTDRSTLRNELLRFPINSDNEHAIPESHRIGLIPILTHLLFPHLQSWKFRTGKNKAGLKQPVLHFFSSFEDEELSVLLGLYLKELKLGFRKTARGGRTANEGSGQHGLLQSLEQNGLLPQPWWVESMANASWEFWSGFVEKDAMKEIAAAVKVRILMNVETILQNLGHKLSPFLCMLMEVITSLLEESCLNLPQTQQQDMDEGVDDSADPDDPNPDQQDQGMDQNKDVLEAEKSAARMQGQMRRHCIKLLSVIWRRFPESCDYGPFVQRIFTALHPWMSLLASACLQSSAPHLLKLVSALSIHPQLALFLGSAQSTQNNSKLTKPHTHSGNYLLSCVLSTVPSVETTKSSHDLTLDIIENLLAQEDDVIQAVLGPHIEFLLEGLRAYIVAVWNGEVVMQVGTARVRVRKEANRELGILEKVANLSMDGHSARNLTEALLPLIGSMRSRHNKQFLDETAIFRALRCLSAVWERIGESLEETGPIFSKDELCRYSDCMSSKAAQLTRRESREALCSAFSALAILNPELKQTADLMSDLNSHPESLLDEVDYDKRLAAFSQLNGELWGRLGWSQALPLINTCLYDVKNDDDISLRQASSEALSRLIKTFTETSDDDASDIPANLTWIYTRLLKNVGARNLAVRQEHLSLLTEIITKYPHQFLGLALLAHPKDKEQDFYHNVAHLQLHRRVRAWGRVKNLLGDEETAEKLATSQSGDILVPLLVQAIFEGRASEDLAHKVAVTDQNRENLVVDVAVQVLSQFSSIWSWPLYSRVLGKLQSMVNKSKNPSKGMIRAMCVVANGFHFDIPSSLPSVENKSTGVEIGNTVEDTGDREDMDCGDADDDRVDVQGKADQAESMQIFNFVFKRTLPTLKTFLLDEESGKARGPVAESLMKLVKKLPPQYEKEELSGSLQKIANLMRNKLQGVRDDARKVFVGMAAELGPKYMAQLCKVLKSALPAKGYGVHVLGFTIASVLDTLSKSAEPGDANDTVELLLPIIEAELFGDVADAKEAKHFASAYKEAKSCRACEMYGTLVKLVDFETCSESVMQLVRNHLVDCAVPKYRKRLTDLLLHASRGILANQSATKTQLMMFVHRTVDSGMRVEEEGIERAQAESGLAVHLKQKVLETKETVAARYEPLIVEFALRVFHSGLKKGPLDSRDAETLGLLDPMLAVLVRCLTSRHPPVSVLALKCICFMVNLPLPSLGSAAEAAGNTVFKMLNKVPSSSDPVAQDCFKFLARILRGGDWFRPTDQQIGSLLVLIGTDLEEQSQQHAGFSLLQTIIAKKILVPGVYDLMKNVQQIMVMSQTASVRQTCSNLLLQFLLNYPLGEVRLMEHLTFVLSNLSYEYETGRMAVLDFLNQIMRKFPPELLEAQAEYFYLPLVTRLANEESKTCKAGVSEVLKQMLHSISAKCCHKLLTVTCSWLKGSDVKLRRTAAQSLGMFAEVLGKNMGQFETEILSNVGGVLEHHVMVMSHDDVTDEMDTAVEWQEVYFALLLVEKVVASLGIKSALLESLMGVQNGNEVDCSGVWADVVSLLSYRHVWVRKVAARLVGRGLSVLGDDELNEQIEMGDVVIGGKSAAELAFLLFMTMKSEGVDGDLARQASKCLVWLAPRLHAQQTGSDQFDDPDDSEENGETPHDRSKSHNSASALNSDVNGVGKGNTTVSVAMLSLVERMAKLAEDGNEDRKHVRLSALKFFAALVSRLGPKDIVGYLVTLLVPLFRILEPGRPSESQGGEVHRVAGEVQAHIREVVGADSLLSAYNKARQIVQSKRMERKKKERLQSIYDPEGTAKRKIRKNKARRETRRAEMKMTKMLKISKAPKQPGGAN